MEKSSIQKVKEIADYISDEILKRRGFMDQEQCDRPLYVFMAEHHSNPWEHVIQILVLEKLQAERTVAYGLELPHNLVSSYFAEDLSSDTLSHPYFSAVFHDPENILQYKVAMCASPEVQSLKAHHAFMRNVPLQLNDAAEKEGELYGEKYPVLDTEHKLTSCFLRAAQVPLEEFCPVFMPLGIYVRNLSLKSHGINHASQTKAEIYIQHMGYVHMAGYAEDGLDMPYEQSMMGLFDKDLDEQYIGVLFNPNNDKALDSVLNKLDPSHLIQITSEVMPDTMVNLFDDPLNGFEMIKSILSQTSVKDVILSYSSALEVAEEELMAMYMQRAHEIGAENVTSFLPPMP